MTIPTARNESEMYELEARSALLNFQRNRNATVHLALARNHSKEKREHSIEHYSSLTILQRVLFPAFASEEERLKMLHDAYTVGTCLMTDVERAAGETLEGLPHEYTGEDEEVFDTKLEAAASSFYGIASLQALALMCGYSVKEVTSLSHDEVLAAFSLCVKFEAQLPWSYLVECVKADIDPSLFTSLLNSRDGLLAMALL